MQTKGALRLFIIEFNSAGGLIHYAYQLASALTNQGITTTLITGRDYELDRYPHNFKVEKRLNVWPVFDATRSFDPTMPLTKRLAMKLFRVLRRILRGGRLIVEWARLTRYLLKEKPDIVQFGEIKFMLLEGIFLFCLRRAGLIVTQICHEFEARESRIKNCGAIDKLHRVLFDNFSAIFFLADENRKRFIGRFHYPASNCHLIAHGNEEMFLAAAAQIAPQEDLKKYYQVTDGEPVVLFFGRITPSKGVPDLIEAFSLIRDRHTAKLIIAGYPSKHVDMEALNRQIERYKLAQNVTVDARYIPIGSVAPLMRLADVVVLPYRSSSQSGALQLAYTFGRPVIATTTGGLPEVVNDGRSGFLVPPANPRQLAAKITTLLDSPSLAKRMGEYGKMLSKNRYDWQPIAEKILEIYTATLRRKGK